MSSQTGIPIIDLPAQVIQDSINLIAVGVPKALTAFIILIAGWFIAKISEKIIYKLLTTMQVDEWIEHNKLKKTLFNINFSSLLSVVFKYYIILVFIKEAALRADLSALAELFNVFLNAIPDIVTGVIIMILALILADFLKNKVRESRFPFNETIAGIIYGLVIFFALVMALPKFGFTNTSLLEDSFKYLVLGVGVGIAIAIGIGFGWAIKEGPAKEFFKKWK